ncbi:MAG: DUF2817 domain-containing protein [Pirellulales bacterium]|nr:DUF2817 domain-containing protein [Pirellulales bacterium]
MSGFRIPFGRFRKAAQRIGWRLEAYPIAAVGPGGDELTIDVASSATEDADNVLVISSGLHGVEGFFGSAVQTMVLEWWASSASPPVRCVFLHALNPYGFAWIRRPNENNEDLKELGATRNRVDSGATGMRSQRAKLSGSRSPL